MPTIRRLLATGLALLLLHASSGCRRVPGTDRSQFNVFSRETEVTMGANAYREIMAGEEQVTGTPMARILERVGRRIAAVSPDPGYEWEFALVRSKTVNAFALPGGKVVFYTGMLPYFKTEADLAVVMGHEIAHVIARHGGERMSHGVFISGVSTAIGAYLETQGVERSQRNMWLAALGAGAQLGVTLPFSRKHEHEADKLGMRYMAKAGYDPRAAPAFWDSFKGASGTPEFLSTHPHDESRATELRAQLQQVLEHYRAAETQHGMGATLPSDR
ncbi:MAG: M48 family metallopeptidase [Planctomycetota bacterium]